MWLFFRLTPGKAKPVCGRTAMGNHMGPKSGTKHGSPAGKSRKPTHFALASYLTLGIVVKSLRRPCTPAGIGLAYFWAHTGSWPYHGSHCSVEEGASTKGA